MRGSMIGDVRVMRGRLVLDASLIGGRLTGGKIGVSTVRKA